MNKVDLENNSIIYKNLRTPVEMFCHWEKNTPDAVYLRQPYGKEWTTFTYQQTGLMARKLVAGMRSMGLKRGDHVGIISKNCCHWIIADLAIMMGGYISVPLYASLQGELLEDILKSSKVKALFVGKLEKWSAETHPVPENIQLISFPHYPGNAKLDFEVKWDDLLEKHLPAEDTVFPSLEDIWTILYSSGTTGRPKGIVHKFKNPALVIRIEELTDFIGIFKIPHQRYFSFLPLNHVGERIGTQINCLATGGTMSFGESIQTFMNNLKDTAPTTFFAVPRIWTKFYEGITSKIPAKLLKLLINIPGIGALLKNAIKKGIGLNQVGTAATGAAITPGYLKEFYASLGIHLIEAYGMTEVCGGICYGVDKETPHDSVGKTFPYCEVKIDNETQEILLKAPFVMDGYFEDPELTSRVLKDGWMLSGDRGEIDDKGNVKIIGRINDTFKTSRGEYIIPNPIESMIENNENIEFVCVCGLAAPQPIAMVTLSETGKSKQIEQIKTELTRLIDSVNENLKRLEKISTIVIHQNPWTELNGFITPTMKVRRAELDRMFKDLYEFWHNQKEQVIFV